MMGYCLCAVRYESQGYLYPCLAGLALTEDWSVLHWELCLRSVGPDGICFRHVPIAWLV